MITEARVGYSGPSTSNVTIFQLDGWLIMAASSPSRDHLQQFARLKSTSYGFGLDSEIEEHSGELAAAPSFAVITASREAIRVALVEKNG